MWRSILYVAVVGGMTLLRKRFTVQSEWRAARRPVPVCCSSHSFAIQISCELLMVMSVRRIRFPNATTMNIIECFGQALLNSLILPIYYCSCGCSCLHHINSSSSLYICFKGHSLSQIHAATAYHKACNVIADGCDLRTIL